MSVLMTGVLQSPLNGCAIPLGVLLLLLLDRSRISRALCHGQAPACGAEAVTRPRYASWEVSRGCAPPVTTFGHLINAPTSASSANHRSGIQALVKLPFCFAVFAYPKRAGLAMDEGLSHWRLG
jgi:hypothetical protein